MNFSRSCLKQTTILNCFNIQIFTFIMLFKNTSIWTILIIVQSWPLNLYNEDDISIQILISDKLFSNSKFTSKEREAVNGQFLFVSMFMCIHAVWMLSRTSWVSWFAEWPPSQSKSSPCLTLRLQASAPLSLHSAFLSSAITNIWLSNPPKSFFRKISTC